MRHHLALVALLAFTGSIAYAGPGRRAGKKPKPIIKVEVEKEDEDDRDEEEEEEEDDEDEVAAAEPADEPADEVEVDVTEVATPKRKPKDWHIAIGPYLWASAVDADVSLGDATVSAGVDFIDVTRHAKYGIEVLAEARYGRFAIYTDFMYGVVGVGGGTDVGPLMVTLEGTASSLLVDGLAGYRVFGSEQSLVSFEARAGVRYQRTEISGSVNVAGTDVSPSTYIDAAADALAGAHAVLRPHWRFYVSGEIDHGVFGASTKTWSATADAGVNITRRVQLSVGWRTLTTSRTNVSIVMHGPRAALQFLF